MNEILQKSIQETNKRKAIEDTKEVQELRRLRDEATKKSQEYQKQIDQKIMELHGTPNLVGKYVKLSLGDHKTHYGLVSKVTRLFKGIKIEYSKAFDISEFREGLIVTMANGEMGYDNSVAWEEFDKISVIPQTEYQEVFERVTQNFK